ncbi:flagellar hook-basal body protein [Anaerobranca gottschalkii]|uniref:Flagellar basal-body rod protein FlgG n=2 Tax=Anaerobranca gottschalkii DSM 13577 TaxID=1120990 RepID=A0A1I0CGC2_9FIRM|nr:flagellar hook-basal body protein [Anaerobranca gottschalkii]SET18653.1 flagellar basal-body rod protein FlgG [Anaerobranca gottschalkii DSM 13577]
MIRSLYTASSGILTGQRQVDNVAHNIANINTMGFKASRLNFKDLFYANLQQRKNLDLENRLSNPGIQIGQGVMPSSITKKFTQGPIITTSNPFDLAIEGQGFFGIERDGELLLTRHGNFHLDESGLLVNGDGYPVVGQFNGSLLNYREINIDMDGVVTGINGQGEREELGVIFLFNVPNPHGLAAIGDNLFSVTENSGEPNPIQSPIRQGALEGSNVDLGEQIAFLMMSQRALEASAKLVQTTDEMMAQANNLRR